MGLNTISTTTPVNQKDHDFDVKNFDTLVDMTIIQDDKNQLQR